MKNVQPKMLADLPVSEILELWIDIFFCFSTCLERLCVRLLCHLLEAHEKVFFVSPSWHVENIC